MILVDFHFNNESASQYSEILVIIIFDDRNNGFARDFEQLKLILKLRLYSKQVLKQNVIRLVELAAKR